MTEPEGFRVWANDCVKALMKMARHEPETIRKAIREKGYTEEQIESTLEIMRRGDFEITWNTESEPEERLDPAPWAALTEHFRKMPR